MIIYRSVKSFKIKFPLRKKLENNRLTVPCSVATGANVSQLAILTQTTSLAQKYSQKHPKIYSNDYMWVSGFLLTCLRLSFKRVFLSEWRCWSSGLTDWLDLAGFSGYRCVSMWRPSREGRVANQNAQRGHVTEFRDDWFNGICSPRMTCLFVGFMFSLIFFVSFCSPSRCIFI